MTMTPIINDHSITIGDHTEPLPALAKPAQVHIWRVPTEYRESGYFVSVQASGQPLELPACAESDAIKLESLTLPAHPTAQLDAAKTERMAAAAQDADQRLAALAAGYPEREIASWPQQIKESEALEADPEAPAPLLSMMATTRGISVTELASRVRNNAAGYSAAAGQILGARHKLDDLLEAAQTPEDVAAVPMLSALLS